MKNNFLPGLYTCINVLFFFAIIQHSFAAHSEENSAKLLYIEGVKTFRNSNFNRALDLFLQAESSGYRTARLYYNIGIAYFKLDKYALAYESLNKASGDPTITFLVNLNAGLVANKLGKLNLAKSRFKLAYANASDDKQRSLANYMLKQLDENIKISTIKKLYASMRFAFGFNDNISLINPLYSLGQTEKNDYFSSVYANLNYNMYSRLNIQTQIYTLQYRNVNEYDFANLSMLMMLKPLMSYKNYGIGLGIEKNYLSGDSLQDIGIFALESRHQQSRESTLDINYQYKNISSADDRYDYLSGSLQRIKLSAALNSKFSIATRFIYEFEFNQRNDEIEVINGMPVFTSHSPSRHKLELSTSIPISYKQNLIIDLEFLNSKYNDPNNVVDDILLLNLPSFAPDILQLSPDTRRKDRRHRSNLKWLYRLNTQINVFIGYDYLSNESNIDEFTYNSRHAEIGLTWHN